MTYRRARTLVVLTGMVWLSLGISPGARAAESDTQHWSLLVINKQFSRRWLGYFEVQPRIGEHIGALDRLLIRPAFGYRITPKLSVWQGYGWTPQFRPDFRGEHRLFQQLLYEDTVGRVSLTSRTRLEERLIENVGGASLRFRSMLRGSLPISADRKWLLIGYDEFFWNLNSPDGGPVSGFDQNRLFLGLGRQVNPQTRVETGYLLNLINAPDPAPNRRLHVWVVQFTLQL